MLLSYSPGQTKFAYFESFLQHILRGEESYKPFVNKILQDAHRLANDRRAILSVDAYGLPIIVYLSRKDQQFFSNLDIANISQMQYKAILDMIQGAAAVPYD